MTKHKIDPLLFKPEPPKDPKLVKRLFCGREEVLNLGLGRLKSGLDVKGKRGAKAGKYPWVIHGESRSGKSHLARRLFAQLPEHKTRLQLRIDAGGKLDAVSVMRELFEELLRQFNDRIHDQTLKADFSETQDVNLVKQLLERTSLFSTGAQTVTLTFEEGSRKAIEAGVEAGAESSPLFITKLLGKFIAKCQREKSQKDGIQLILRPPTAGDLAEMCGIMAEVLLLHGLVEHILILLDDFDLLDTYVSPQNNAKAERATLGSAVRFLHSVPGVDVVITARSWYFNSEDKHLVTLIDLFEHPMPAAEMLGIYKVRLDTYAKSNTVAAFLSPDALAQLAGDVSGFPGIFLQHVHTAFYQFQKEEESHQRGYDWLLQLAHARLAALKDHCPAGYEAIIKAVNLGQLSIDVKAGNPFFGTRLENDYVYQSYISETSYFLPAIVRKLIPGVPKTA